MVMKTEKRPLPKFKAVILDAGHGSNTPGKRSPEWPGGVPPQLFEFSFNLEIVRRLQKRLTDAGYNVARVNTEAEKDVSVGVRVARINKMQSNFPEAVLISVHANAALKPNTGTGWEAFISQNASENSKVLGSLLYEEATRLLPEEFPVRVNTKKDPVKVMNLQILRDSFCPAVLTENLFFDNIKDCTYMQTEGGINTIVDIHFQAVERYFKENFR